jgi:hypothetical protein
MNIRVNVPVCPLRQERLAPGTYFVWVLFATPSTSSSLISNTLGVHTIYRFLSSVASIFVVLYGLVVHSVL